MSFRTMSWNSRCGDGLNRGRQLDASAYLLSAGGDVSPRVDIITLVVPILTLH